MTDLRRSRAALVVDDHAAARLLCRVNLEADGWRVTEAADGRDALELARSQRPDVILLDVMMPGFSGWRVAAELAADTGTVAIPIVFITGLADRPDRLRGLGRGAAGYITKPFNPNELGPALTAMLERIEHGDRPQLLAEELDRLSVKTRPRRVAGPGLP